MRVQTAYEQGLNQTVSKTTGITEQSTVPNQTKRTASGCLHQTQDNHHPFKTPHQDRHIPPSWVTPNSCKTISTDYGPKSSILTVSAPPYCECPTWLQDGSQSILRHREESKKVAKISSLLPSACNPAKARLQSPLAGGQEGGPFRMYWSGGKKDWFWPNHRMEKGGGIARISRMFTVPEYSPNQWLPLRLKEKEKRFTFWNLSVLVLCWQEDIIIARSSANASVSLWE